MRRMRFINGEFYHVYNRGVEKRRIFMDDKDYLRFIHCLFEFNDVDTVLNFGFHYRGSTSIVERKPRKLLVDIIAFALMPNHYHLVLRQRSENGIPIFLQKIGTGYTMYFNAKHDRSGVLFQGAYKAKHVHEDRYLRYLVQYIHLNPVDIFQNNWEEDGINNLQKTLTFLEQHRWSSYLDYLNKPNFPSVLNLTLAHKLDLLDRHKQVVTSWLQGRAGRGSEAMSALSFD